jgi:hypothetical protein
MAGTKRLGTLVANSGAPDTTLTRPQAPRDLPHRRAGTSGFGIEAETASTRRVYRETRAVICLAGEQFLN